MIERSGESFLHACGSDEPLHVEIEGPGPSSPSPSVFDQPFLLIGRHHKAGLNLDHDEVSQRHAYLQVVDGRIFCLDLESRTGTRLEPEGSGAGWLGSAGTIRIGPYRVRVWLGDSASDPRTDDSGPGPLSSAYVSPRSLARATLRLLDGDEPRSAYVLRRAVTLVGGSALCKLRIRDSAASKFYGALVRTPSGIWFVDLRSSAGVRINGRSARRPTRLIQGDVLQIGRRSMLVTYEESESSRTSPGGELHAPLVLPNPPGVLIEARGAQTSPELQPILHQVALMQQQMCDQFQQAMLMMSRMFGSMHQDHMEVVRSELEQIRRLTEEMQALRDTSTSGREAPSPSPVQPEPPPPQLGVFQGAPETSEGDRYRPDPRELHDMVSKRLAAFERERQTRWNRILRLLSNA